MRSLASALLLAALPMLTGCGGAGSLPATVESREDGASEDVGRTVTYEIEAPLRKDAVAAAVTPEGDVRVKRGVTPEEKAAGRGRRIYPFRANRVHLVTDASQPWARVERALRESFDTGLTDLDIDVAAGGSLTCQLSFRTGTRATRRLEGPLVLQYRYLESEGIPMLEATCYGTAWFRARGCTAIRGGRWPREMERLPSEALDLLGQAQRVARQEGVRLQVGVDVVEPEAGNGARVDEVALLLEALVAAGVAFIDLELRDRRAGYRWEGAVDRGLSFLAAHQSPGGAWAPHRWAALCDREPMPSGDEGAGDAAFEVGQTALALTAFLGAGYTNRGKHPFAGLVSRAASYLMKAQQADGAFLPAGARWRGRSHALATLAMTQLYLSTENPAFRASAHDALAALEAVWRASRQDALATMFTVLAIHVDEHVARERAGRNEEPHWEIQSRGALRAEVLAECVNLMSSARPRDTAIGCAGVMLLDDDPDARHIAGRLLDLLGTVKQDPLRDPATFAFGILAAFRVGGPTWKSWNVLVKDVVVPAQQEGEFCCLGGSWDDHASSPGGRLESTALFLLACEIYYRYDKVVGTK